MIALFLTDVACAGDWVRAITCYETELRRNGCRLPQHLVEVRTAALERVRESQSGSFWTPTEEEAQSADVEPLAHTYSRVADRLGVSLATVKRLVKAGQLPVVAIHGAPRVRAEDLDRYVAGLSPRHTPKDAA